MNQDLDLLIAGAGPVGLSLAVCAKKQGLRFRIIDESPEPSNHSKALAIWSGTLEFLDKMEVIEAFQAEARAGGRLVMCDTGKRVAEVRIDEGVDSPHPQPVFLPQSRTERILIRHLEGLGVEVERPVELVAFENAMDRVTCTLKHGSGCEETVRARFLASCEGARSMVRKHLPVTFDGETENARFLLVDCEIEASDLKGATVLVNWSANGTIAVFPVSEGVWRIFSQREGNDESAPTLEEMQTRVREVGLDWKLSNPTWLANFGINERAASKFRVGSVFLLGDAAHIHSPAGGQGMNTGIQDACNLGWKLGLLSRGIGSIEKLAQSYHAERHPVAEKVIQMTSMMFDAGLSSSLWVRKLKDLALSLLTQTTGFHQFVAANLSELKISYEQSPIINYGLWWNERRGIEAGHRVADARLEDAATGEVLPLWELFTMDRHTLLCFIGDKRGAIERVLSLASLSKAPLQILCIARSGDGFSAPEGARLLIDTDGSAFDIYGAKETSWVMVRPDLYVAARSQPADADALRDYLDLVCR